MTKKLQLPKEVLKQINNLREWFKIRQNHWDQAGWASEYCTTQPMPDNERLEVWKLLQEGYCKECGKVDLNSECQCWNDE